jgi:hypothetical protein
MEKNLMFIPVFYLFLIYISVFFLFDQMKLDVMSKSTIERFFFTLGSTRKDDHSSVDISEETYFETEKVKKESENLADDSRRRSSNVQMLRQVSLTCDLSSWAWKYLVGGHESRQKNIKLTIRCHIKQKLAFLWI